MAVAFDVASSPVTTGTGTLSWTHTPVGTPKGVLVFVVQDAGTTDQVTGVTYGGVSMTELAGSPNILTTGAEPGAVYGYFLGASIPTGAQTVSVSVSGSSTKAAVSMSVTASSDTEVVDTDNTVNTDNAGANPSGTLSLAGRTCFCALGGFSGVGAVTNTGPRGGWTDRGEHDFGNTCAGFYSYDTIGSTDVTTAGLLQSSGVAAVVLSAAISEVSGGGGGSRKIMVGMF